ncbi:MAG: MFS transporter [Myxococcales bacterium]|nr:MFS transporter [Myxococcales bacterium]
MSAAPRALILWYAAVCGAMTLGPWLALHLRDQGLSDSQIALLLLAMPIGRLLGGPLWAWVADRLGAAGPVLKLGNGLAALFVGLLCVSSSPWVLVLAVCGWATSSAPMLPIADAATVRWVGRRYGRVRLVGSAAFGIGVVVAGVGRDAWALTPVVQAAILLAVATLVALALPPLPTKAPAPPRVGQLLGLLRHGSLAPVVVASLLHGASLTAYDSFFALHLDALGAPTWATGVAFAIGVAVEVGVLAVAPGLLERFGPRRLFTVGVASAVPRFAITGWATSVPLIVGVQALHGLTFGAMWIGATALYAELAPASLRNSTQALLHASMFGAGRLVGLLLAAPVLEAYGPDVLFGVAAAASAAAWALLAATRRERRSHPPG